MDVVSQEDAQIGRGQHHIGEQHRAREQARALVREADAVAAARGDEIAMIVLCAMAVDVQCAVDGQHDGFHYLTMEYVEGKTVRELITEKGIDYSRALDIAVQVAEALRAAGSDHRCPAPSEHG